MPPFALAAGLTQGVNVLREAGNRLVGIPEIAGSLAGSRRPKKLRIRVVILRDEQGKPVATAEDVEPSLAEARRVLREGLAIDLLAAAEPLVRTLEAPAPAAALDSPCAEGSYKADFGEGGAFFRRHRRAGQRLTGSGGPITVFVVRDVLGKAGCSLGPLVDYVTVDMTALQERASASSPTSWPTPAASPIRAQPRTSCCRAGWATACSPGRSRSSAAPGTSPTAEPLKPTVTRERALSLRPVSCR